MVEIANTIAYYRENRQMSQEELALRTRISLRSIQQIETGEVYPDNNKLLMISTVLDIPISALIISRKSRLH